MKKLLMLAAACLCLWSVPGGAQLRPDPIELNIPNIEQERNTWCWAALAQQVLVSRTYGSPPSQCELVTISNIKLGHSELDCCQNQTDPVCDRFGDQRDSIGLVTQYGGQARQVPLPSPEEIYNYLVAGSPLIIIFQRTEDAKHAYLVRGLSWVGDEARLLINDPAGRDSQTVNYDLVRPSWADAIVIE